MERKLVDKLKRPIFNSHPMLLLGDGHDMIIYSLSLSLNLEIVFLGLQIHPMPSILIKKFPTKRCM